MKRTPAGIVTIVLIASLLSSVDASDSVPTSDQHRIRVLVEALASKNIAPGLGDLPKNYDKNAQVVVYLAVQQLLAEGSAAFDILIEHFNDKRYAYTDQCPDGNYDRTVGDVCRMIGADVSSVMIMKYILSLAISSICIWTTTNGGIWPTGGRTIDIALCGASSLRLLTMRSNSWKRSIATRLAQLTRRPAGCHATNLNPCVKKTSVCCGGCVFRSTHGKKPTGQNHLTGTSVS